MCAAVRSRKRNLSLACASVPDNYTEERPTDLFAVRANWVLIQSLLKTKVRKGGAVRAIRLRAMTRSRY